ncbi:MAG: hypothetical protein ACYDGN_11050 [Acidimicrobiales bacterium]
MRIQPTFLGYLGHFVLAHRRVVIVSRLVAFVVPTIRLLIQGVRALPQ